MSTNSLIVTKTPEGKYKGIYCHWNGYVEDNGMILQEHYTEQEKIDKLMDLGAISVLKASPECPEGHTFNTPVEGYCVSYGRDRGDENEEAIVADTVEDVDEKFCGIEFIYEWDGTQWFVTHKHGYKRKTIEEALERDKELGYA